MESYDGFLASGFFWGAWFLWIYAVYIAYLSVDKLSLAETGIYGKEQALR